MTISPPPAVGGLVMRIDPFVHMFDRPSDENGATHHRPARQNDWRDAKSVPRTAEGGWANPSGYAFVAMPMDKNDHQLVDVLEAIKAGAKECGVTAERIDDDERNEGISDRMLGSIRMAQFVIVDLTNERPIVFYEAGYAHGIGKIPIYIARNGTNLHFDVKDYVLEHEGTA
jgi:hypothetical protein